MKFFLKTKKTMGISTLFFEVNKRTPKFKAQFNTFVPVDIQQWTKAQETAKNLTKYMSSPEGAKVYSLLQAIENAVNDLFLKKRIQGAEDKHIISEAVSTIAFADERQRIAEEQARKEAEEKAAHDRIVNRYRDILAFYGWFMESARNGVIRTGGNKYKDGTLGTWETFGKYLKGYMSTRNETTFDDITPLFRDEFVQYLLNLGLMVGSVSLNVSKFRALCKAAAKYGYNNNAVSLQGWESKRADRDEKKAEIYLTEYELSELYKMPLSGTRATVRDMFFVGASIAQRFGDYSRISKDMVQEIEGVKFLMFQQEKTGKDMVIPLIDARVLDILERYGYSFPKISLMHFNSLLRENLKELSDSVPSLMEEYPTAPTKADPRTVKAKWEIVSSHTARRSAVTNMSKRGELSKREMMAITGHSTEKIFEEYIKLGTLEQAKRIAEKLSRGNESKASAKIG